MKISATLSCILAAASTAIAAPVEKRQFGLGGGSTSNDLKSGKCAAVTFIFARGSTEPGNMGSAVGPHVASALKSQLGDVAIQGVDYTATMTSNVSQGAPGGKKMAELVKMAKTKCPNTKIAVGGYSQGAMVVHQALKTVGNDVSAAVLYGDPKQRSAIRGTPNKKFCNSSDGVCVTGGFAISPGHMTYNANGDTKKGAAFIAQHVKGGSAAGGTSGDSGEASGEESGLGGLMGGGAPSLGSGGFGSLMGGGGDDEAAGDEAPSTGMGGGLGSLLG